MNSFSDEVNSKHSNSSILGKRKKVREKRSHYLKKWLEKSTQHTLDVIPDYDFRDSNSTSQMNGNCWNPPYAFYGQRLFNAASDPSVFRYPNPYGYPPEPISLPLYPPILCPPPLSTHYPNPPAWGQPSPMRYSQTPQRKNRGSNNPRKIPVNRNTSNVGVGNDFNRAQNSHLPSTNKYDPRNTSSAAGPIIDFASLPPVINHVSGPYDGAGQEDDTSGNQRRFSDPGIAQNPSFDQSQEESQDETDSDSSGPGGSQAENRLIMCLVDQIHTLKETNGKLYKALHDTRGELDALKQQSAIWRSDSASNLRIPPQPSHPLSAPSSAGMANPPSASAMYSPGMLADLVREIRDAARIREEALYAKVRLLLEERNTTNKNQIHTNLTDKSRTNDRLGKLEEELHNLRLNQSRDESMSSPCSMQGYGPLSQSEQERLRLRAELNEERAARVTSDANAHKLELLVTQLRSKRGHTPSRAGSLNGSAISSTPDTLHMVLGPVTDL